MRPAGGQQQGSVRHRQQQWNTQDDTTRYLCAAAHLDSAFADAAIREFLLEPTRPVPPSPGYHAASVLVEAVAARTRRKVRDATLAVLALPFVWLAWGTTLLYSWVALAVVASLPALWHRSASPQAATLKVGCAIIALAGAPFVLTGFAPDPLGGLLSAGFDDQVQCLAACVLCFLMLVVLVADRLIVWQLAYGRFGRRARHLPPSNPFDQQRTILNVSPSSFLRQLVRYAAPAPDAAAGTPLVVYRGPHPFVGAGIRRSSWSVALPLEKLSQKENPGESAPGELSTAKLYETIRAAMASLSHNAFLSPGQRLGELSVSDAVFVPADKLIDHLNQPESAAYLPNPDSRPNPVLPAEEVIACRTRPTEWARYYLCFRIPVWGDDSVLSGFLHASVSDDLFYLEWTQCVLPPVREEYRAIDKPPGGPFTPVVEAVLRWVKLPVTLIGRLRHTLEVLLPAHRERGVFNADVYGSARTLREMAADDRVRDQLHLSDLVRYEKILHSTLVRTVSRLLRDCGYSAERFERQATAVAAAKITIE